MRMGAGGCGGGYDGWLGRQLPGGHSTLHPTALISPPHANKPFIYAGTWTRWRVLLPALPTAPTALPPPLPMAAPTAAATATAPAPAPRRLRRRLVLRHGRRWRRCVRPAAPPPCVRCSALPCWAAPCASPAWPCDDAPFRGQLASKLYPGVDRGRHAAVGPAEFRWLHGLEM